MNDEEMMLKLLKLFQNVEDPTRRAARNCRKIRELIEPLSDVDKQLFAICISNIAMICEVEGADCTQYVVDYWRPLCKQAIDSDEEMKALDNAVTRIIEGVKNIEENNNEED